MSDEQGWLGRRRKWGGVGAAIIGVVVIAAVLWGAQWLTPGQREIEHPAIPDKILQIYTVVGPGGNPESNMDDTVQQLLSTYGDAIDALIPTWYTLTLNGELVENPNWARQEEVIGDLPRQPLIIMGEAGTASPFYQDQERSRQAVDQLLEIAGPPGTTGLQLDLRAVQSHLANEEMHEFLELVSTALNGQNQDKELILLVAPDHDQVDLRKLSEIADAIHIPAFREYEPDEDPGPVAPLEWMRAAVDRAMEEIQDPKQLILGIPAFGYRWTFTEGSLHEPPEHIPYSEASRQAGETEAGEPSRTETEIPHYRYVEGTDEHQVWYEDGISARPKLQYAREWNLRGIAVWNLEMTDDTYWRAIIEEQ